MPSQQRSGKVEIRTRKKFVVVGEAYLAVLLTYSRFFKWKTLVRSGFSTEGTIISVSVSTV